MKIAEVRSPELFQRLVHRLFVAERGVDFQTIDDSGGDRGNDGYDPTRGILYSIYCPEKPETANTRRKAKSDLAKAHRLVDAPGYSIRGWAFVTPNPLREGLQSELRAEAEGSGLQAQFISSIYLEDLYRRHGHLHDEFPELQYPSVAEELRALRLLVEGISASPSTMASTPKVKSRASDVPLDNPSRLHGGTFTGFLSPALSSFAAKLEAGDTSALAEVERYRLEAVDDRDHLDALMVELQYRLDHNERPRAFVLTVKGLDRARRLELHADRAIFAATLGHLKSLDLIAADLDLNLDLETTRMAGVPFASVGEITRAEGAVTQLRNEVNALIVEALQSAQESGNLVSALTALQYQASVLAFQYFPLALKADFGRDPQSRIQIDALKMRVENVYELAIRIATSLGHDFRLATTYGNYANDLDTFGERTRAIGHARHAIALASRSGNFVQVEKSTSLLEKIARETTTPL